MSNSFFRRNSAPISLVALASMLLSMTPARYAHAQDHEEAASPPADVKPADVKDTAPKAEASHPSLKDSQAGRTDSVSADEVKQAPQSAKPIEKAPNPADAVDPSHVRSLPTGENKSGATAQAISVPKGPGTIQGMGESFSAQPSTGISNFSVPFALLKARGGAQPSLSLGYSSSGGNGIAGIGWDVSVPYISRQTDRGLPKYKDQATWHAEQDRFVLNGGQELVPIGSTGLLETEELPVWASGWQYFRARVEGSYLRFFWNPSLQVWRVQDKSGSLMEFGIVDGANDALEFDPSNSGRVFRWNLKRQLDAHGNPVVYSYFRDGNLSYLKDIYDTPPVSGGNVYSQWAHHTRLGYEPRSDISRGFNRGWETIKTWRLATVAVTGKSDTTNARQLVRRYHLEYDSNSHVSLLKSLKVDGTCNKAIENQAGDVTATNCDSLPPMSFGYTQVAKTGQPSYTEGFENFDTEIHDLANSPNHSVDEDYTDLYDVNADGLPDVVTMMPGLFGGKHGLWLQGKTGVADTFGPQQGMCVNGVLGANESIITKRNSNIVALDLTADGKIDLLHMPKVKTYSVYTPKLSGLDWCWQGRTVATADKLDPRIDFGTDALDLRVFDVNGDGMVDVVKSSGTAYQTWYSLGRYPGGDGQFGSATWSGPSSANLDMAPVQRCVPWSGAPLRFSDSDVKIADMNGDGLTDIVRVRKGDIKYWPGRGDGTFGTGALGCAAGTFSQDGYVQMTANPQYSAPDAGELQLHDVNGDGTSDIVHVRFQDASVWINVDGSSWTKERLINKTPANPNYRSRVRLTDMNGSGTPDILWGDGLAYRYIDLAGGKRPWLLNHVENGLGKSTDIEYTTSTAEMLKAASGAKPWKSVVPTVLHMVSKVTVSDNLDKIGRPAGHYITEYGFDSPVYDGLQREFRGFSATRVRTLGDDNSPTSETETSFDLGERPTSYVLDSPKVDYTDPRNAWMDNPREALKGLATITDTYSLDTSGKPWVYLSTSHTGYRLRRLYTGLDGRRVIVAFAETSDNYLYDTGNYKSGATPALKYPTSVNHQDASGTPSAETVKLQLHASDGIVHTRSTSEVDIWGNKTEEVAYGVFGVDEEIHSFTVPDLVPTIGLLYGDGRWSWRTKESYVYGSDIAKKRKHTRVTAYTDWGDPISSEAHLEGSVHLGRTNNAPQPFGAAEDDWIPMGKTAYDAFGHAVFTTGPEGTNRCSRVTYDLQYAEFPGSETIFAGVATKSVDSAICGAVELTSLATYDRPTQQVSSVIDPNSATTSITYDEFGRMRTMTKPRILEEGAVEPLPSLIVEYKLGNPISRLVSKTQDGKTTTEASYIETHAVVDGLGRTIVTLSERDHAQDEHPWVVDGLTDYDQKGAARRKYLPWGWDGTAESYDLSTPAATAYGQQRYDAFGRVMETTGLDGTITLRTRYHSLSADAWDAEDIAAGTHYGTYASETKDGHGRVVRTTERVRAKNGGLEERHTDMTYLITGEVTKISRKRGTDTWSRSVEYDTLGHMVRNHEPSSGTWLYAYDRAGALVGMSDARQCGANYTYDSAGRLVAEDYAPCDDVNQPAYSSSPEVTYEYDTEPSDWSQAFPGMSSGYSLGKLVAVTDRASRSMTAFDSRGRAIAAAKAVASPSGILTSQWFRIQSTYDAGDRPLLETTGATVGITDPWASKTMTSYTTGGSVKNVDSTYGMLVENVKRSPDGKVEEIKYGDAAHTITGFTYDDLRRLRTLTTYRSKMSGWETPSQAGAGFAEQMLLQDEEFTYDRVGNPTEIRDYRDPAEWPASAKPVNRKMKYDDLYRMSEIDYQYPGGSDQWTDVYGSEKDVLKASPRADLTTAGRPLKQTYEYDWRGNLVESDDNAHAFYDRSLGTQSHVENTDQLTHAENNQKGGAFTGHLDVQYDLTGNIDTLTINRNGDCKPSKDACRFQQYKYEWDEVGRLMRARRYDSTNTGSDPPAAELTFAYDSGNNRVRKTSGLNHTIYIFDSLELRNTQFDNSALTYEVSDATEVPYVFAHGVRLGRVVHQSDTVTKLYMELGDHLGSTSVVLEHGTGKLIERNTAYAYGAPESNYRSDVDPDFREDYRFTGKEDDIEVGLIYFGQRYYVPLLQRWLSPDPLAVHAPGQADLNVYAYVHGRVLSAVDPVGLQAAGGQGGGEGSSGDPGPSKSDPGYTATTGDGTTVSEPARTIVFAGGNGGASGTPTNGNGGAQGTTGSPDAGERIAGGTVADVGKGAKAGAMDLVVDIGQANYSATSWFRSGGRSTTWYGRASRRLNSQRLTYPDTIAGNAGHALGYWGPQLVATEVASEVYLGGSAASSALKLTMPSLARVAGSGRSVLKVAPFNPSRSLTNCVNGVSAFLNSVKNRELVTASADVAANFGSIARANHQITAATGVRLSQAFQRSTLNTARARQFFIVYPGQSASVAEHVMIGINNGGKTMLYDPQIGAKIFDISSFGPFVAFPIAF